jgi:hypothetical protein
VTAGYAIAPRPVHIPVVDERHWCSRSHHDSI